MARSLNIQGLGAFYFLRKKIVKKSFKLKNPLHNAKK